MNGLDYYTLRLREYDDIDARKNNVGGEIIVGYFNV